MAKNEDVNANATSDAVREIINLLSGGSRVDFFASKRTGIIKYQGIHVIPIKVSSRVIRPDGGAINPYMVY